MLTVVGLDLGPHLRKRLHIGCLDFIEQNNVITETGLDRSGKLGDLHRKQGVGERPDKIFVRRPAQIAAFGAGAAIVRVFRDQRRKILAGAGTLKGFAGPGFRRRVVPAIADRDQDMPGPSLLVGLVVGRNRVVIILQSLLVHFDTGQKIADPDFQILDFGRLLGQETPCIEIVITGDFLVGGRYQVRERTGVDPDQGDFPLLSLQLQETPHFAGRDKGTVDQALLHLQHFQLASLVTFEAGF